MEFPKEIFQNILSFVPVVPQEFKEFVLKAMKATKLVKRLNLPRFCRNLRYDAHGLYSFQTLISEIDLQNKTIKRLGWWSRTSSGHHNWACKYLKEHFDFTEIKVKVTVLKRMKVCGVCAVELGWASSSRHGFDCLMRDAISGNNYLS